MAIPPAAREYEAFGNLIPNSATGTWPGRFGYQGQSWQEIFSSNGNQRLLLSPTRLYDPVTGRFLQNERILKNRPSEHYLYVIQNLVNRVDPLGAQGWETNRSPSNPGGSPPGTDPWGQTPDLSIEGVYGFGGIGGQWIIGGFELGVGAYSGKGTKLAGGVEGYTWLGGSIPGLPYIGTGGWKYIGEGNHGAGALVGLNLGPFSIERFEDSQLVYWGISTGPKVGLGPALGFGICQPKSPNPPPPPPSPSYNRPLPLGF